MAPTSKAGPGPLEGSKRSSAASGEVHVGDLVRWTNPGHVDIGIVTMLNWRDLGSALVHWFKYPEHSGPYDPTHHYLEVISARR
jgi:hypothetical protein